ncbi:hypothetical protein CK203_007455 [Vitis vinifera]|uniref:Transcription initiation factor IIA subunit 1 n=1 Tax=Vitis vinifera TaxID=29760 RepID=A0A438G1Q1_VITVI|nr:hypothetical protein CK203_007455 [Vitis vinifera]
MAVSSMTSTVYVSVIEDVINKVRDEFVNNGGPGESVLSELQGIWEMKMVQAGVVTGPIERSNAPKQTSGAPAPTPPVHDLNVPYEGTEEYETPTAEILFPPTPLQTPIQTPLPGMGDNSMYNIPTGPTEYPAAQDGGGATDMKSGRPPSYMVNFTAIVIFLFTYSSTSFTNGDSESVDSDSSLTGPLSLAFFIPESQRTNLQLSIRQEPPPSPWMQQRPPLSVDVNVAYVEGRDEGDRGNSQQPLTQDFFMMSSGKRKREDFPSQYHTSGYIPQQDGAGDPAPEVFEVECGASNAA